MGWTCFVGTNGCLLEVYSNIAKMKKPPQMKVLGAEALNFLERNSLITNIIIVEVSIQYVDNVKSIINKPYCF